jgi:hypothetical protein
VADALGAVVFNLTQRMPSMPIPIQAGVTDEGAAAIEREDQDHSWVTEGKTLVRQESGKKPTSGGIVGTRPEDPNEKPMPFIKG